jgi:prophage regulatory protein
MAAINEAHPRIIRRADVEARTGLPRSTLYDRIKRGEFPAPIPLSARAVGWLEHEVDAWLADRIAKARNQT